MVRELRPDDLPTALDWVSTRAPSPELVGDPMVDLENTILEIAAKHVTKPAVLNALVNILTAWLSDNKVYWNVAGKGSILGQIAEDTDIRRTLLRELVPQVANDKSARDALIWTHDQFRNATDAPWILSQLRSASTPEHREAWIRITARMLRKLGRRRTFTGRRLRSALGQIV